MEDVGGGCGWLIVYDALLNVAYRVVFSCTVICFGDKILGHLTNLCPVHIVAYSVSPQCNMCTSFQMF
jgi:hypothetical protein